MIGFYGGACNNLYVIAKAMHDFGLEFLFVEDRDQGFPHGQPVWDDVDLYFSTGFESASVGWDAFEEENGWRPPVWYFKPEKQLLSYREVFRNSTAPLLIRFFACRYLRAREEVFSVFNELSKCDFLIVCGVRASILAMLTGRPYMIIPHGSDMRLAIGAEHKPGVKGWLVEFLAAYSFRKANFIGSSLPDGSAEVERGSYRRFKSLEVQRVPIPYKQCMRLSDTERRAKLNELFISLGRNLPSAKYYCFTPSRINFHWKGHDRLLRAIEKNKDAPDIHFIFLGWGDDYLEAVEYVERQCLTNVVTILPLFLSKKYLMRFFTSVDFIIDSLNGNGGYGTSLSEAMSVGCPVVTWISNMFDQPGWERPPVIQARTEDELDAVIKEISQGKIDLALQSKIAADWFARVHASDKVFEVLQEKICIRR